MRAVLLAGGVAAALAMAGFAATAMVSVARAVRMGGFRLLFDGLAWIMPPEDLPAAARSHLRHALTRWLCAMSCLALTGAGFGLAMALP